MQHNLVIRQLGLQPYLPVYQAMHNFTRQRTEHTPDEIWLVQHPAVFTQGRVGKAEHLLSPTTVPVIQTDRGGQITYHGPGQLILYVLLNLSRKPLTIRQLVSGLETTIINLLASFSLVATTQHGAPGVYIDKAKICSLGLHIHRSCSLHGLALNVDMDLTPFTLINPCGYPNLAMTQLKTLRPDISIPEISQELIHQFCQQFNYPVTSYQTWDVEHYG